MEDQLRKSAIEYHRSPTPGKISVTPTKGLLNQHDLSLAYTPGVAAACELIVAEPAAARNMTARGNLVGVITNGTAVLGLGDIGPLAAKPEPEIRPELAKQAKAAMDSGVATRPIADFDAYRDLLQQFVYHSGMIVTPTATVRRLVNMTALTVVDVGAERKWPVSHFRNTQ